MSMKIISCSGYYYNIAICDFDPAEDNYEDFCNLASTRSQKNIYIEKQKI